MADATLQSPVERLVFPIPVGVLAGRRTILGLTGAARDWIVAGPAIRPDWLTRVIGRDLTSDERRGLARGLALLRRVAEAWAFRDLMALVPLLALSGFLFLRPEDGAQVSNHRRQGRARTHDAALASLDSCLVADVNLNRNLRAP